MGACASAEAAPPACEVAAAACVPGVAVQPPCEVAGRGGEAGLQASWAGAAPGGQEEGVQVVREGEGAAVRAEGESGAWERGVERGGAAVEGFGRVVEGLGRAEEGSGPAGAGRARGADWLAWVAA